MYNGVEGIPAPLPCRHDPATRVDFRGLSIIALESRSLALGPAKSINLVCTSLTLVTARPRGVLIFDFLHFLGGRMQ